MVVWIRIIYEWVHCQIMHPHHFCIFICRCQKLYYYCTPISALTLIFLTNLTCFGLSLFIYMHLFSYIIILHLPVVFSIGILLHLVASSGFTLTCPSSAKSLISEPFFMFADILVIQVVFTQTSRWFSQYPYLRPIRMWIYHPYDTYWWNTSYTGVTCLLFFISITHPLNIMSIIIWLFFEISSGTSPNR